MIEQPKHNLNIQKRFMSENNGQSKKRFPSPPPGMKGGMPIWPLLVCLSSYQFIFIIF